MKDYYYKLYCFFISILTALTVLFLLSNHTKLAWIAFFVMAPLFTTLLTQKSLRSYLLISSSYSACFYFILLFPTYHYSYSIWFLGTLIGILKNGVFFFIIWCLIREFKNKSLLTFLVASIFYLISIIFAHNPYVNDISLGGMLSAEPALLNFLKVTGPYGLDFIIIYTNVFFALLFLSLLKHKQFQLRSLLLPLIIAVPFLWLTCRTAATQHPSQTLKVAIVQGAFSREDYILAETNDAKVEEIATRYLSLSHEAEKAGAELLVWPETALKKAEHFQNNIFPIPLQAPLGLVSGLLRQPDLNPRPYNSVVSFTKEGAIESFYDKILVVPLAENEYFRGETFKPLSVSLASFATPICYEILFPDFVSKLVRSGSQAIINITNEAGLRSDFLAQVFMNQAILRAVENNQYLVRASQSGPSIIVSNTGELLAKLNFLEKGQVIAEISLLSSTNKPPKFSLIIFISLFLVLLVLSLYERRYKCTE